MRDRQAISVVVPDPKFSTILGYIGRLREIESNGMLGITLKAKFCQSRGSKTYDTIVFGLFGGVFGRAEIEVSLRNLPEQFKKSEDHIRDVTLAVESIFNAKGIESLKAAANAMNDFVDKGYPVEYDESLHQ